MDKKICIAIDAMGGENAPIKNIEGISLFCKKYIKKDDYFFNIFGDENKINIEQVSNSEKGVFLINL